MRKFFLKQNRLTFALFGLFFFASSASAQKSKCFDYERTDFSVRGKIERVKINKETIWVLKLAKKACFDGGTADSVDVAENNITDLQLLLSAEEYKQYRSFVNKNVVIKGGFFHSHTIHHYTKVLLDVESVELKSN